VLAGASFAGLAALLPPELLAACSSVAARTRPAGAHLHGVFSPHAARVVEEATARLIPGPTDDPAEKGHPGAREANVTRYIDTMLGALGDSPPRVFAGGPFSNRAGWAQDDMARFLRLSPPQEAAWRRRLAGLRSQYAAGIAELDRLAGGDFTKAAPETMDRILAKDPGGFMSLMFGHAIEAMYSVPEYGGNAHLVGWHEIRWPGDRQPRGFTDEEVSRSDGPDPYVPKGVGAQLLQLVAAAP
jgi:Gluconate 2-dehydrogenase subunit 3